MNLREAVAVHQCVRDVLADVDGAAAFHGLCRARFPFATVFGGEYVLPVPRANESDDETV